MSRRNRRGRGHYTPQALPVAAIIGRREQTPGADGSPPPARIGLSLNEHPPSVTEPLSSTGAATGIDTPFEPRGMSIPDGIEFFDGRSIMTAGLRKKFSQPKNDGSGKENDLAVQDHQCIRRSHAIFETAAVHVIVITKKRSSSGDADARR